jgi:FKBP-type peptidyl-prolyl cis-trans isomerase
MPDVFGPNGKDYVNDDASLDNADFGMDIIKKGDQTKPTCSTGAWATVHWTGKLKNGRVVTDSRAENS